ncbi:MAG: hypothetical protein H0T44_02275 [Gemmatimonadales bacterium]|nr:hypothetical protein [Gemmatimonadales bacterium]
MRKSLDKNALEWTVFGVGLILVLATIVYLAREALATDSLPPDVTAVLGPTRPGRDGFQVPVTVQNRGDRVAEDVTVTVLLAGPPEQEAVLTIGFLPRHSTRQGWVRFNGSPAAPQLRVTSLGFASP